MESPAEWKDNVLFSVIFFSRKENIP